MLEESWRRGKYDDFTGLCVQRFSIFFLLLIIVIISDVPSSLRSFGEYMGCGRDQVENVQSDPQNDIVEPNACQITPDHNSIMYLFKIAEIVSPIPRHREYT
jgi:hypothetical protein